MISRLLLLRGCRSPLSGMSLCQKTVHQTAGATDIYVAANRIRLYRTLGLFCLVQGSAWCIVGYYLLSKINAAALVTWSGFREDLDIFNRHVASRLESLTPEAIKRVILRPRREQEKKGEEEPFKELPEAAKRTGERLKADVKEFSKQVKLAIGLEPEGATEKAEGEQEKEALSEDKARSKRIAPYLCFVMGVFTLFVGGFIPRRVIRRIQVLPWQQGMREADRLDPPVALTTYGWFGVFPKRGSTLRVPMSAIRATSEYREGNKFMNLAINRRLFVFYLERFEAEFLMPEYFEHLNSTVANPAVKKQK